MFRLAGRPTSCLRQKEFCAFLQFKKTILTSFLSNLSVSVHKPQTNRFLWLNKPHAATSKRAIRLAPAKTRTRVVRLGAQCTDHWTTEQSRGVGVPAVQLTTHVKSSTLYGRTVVRSYIQIFSAWCVTTILYNYGATLCELRYYTSFINYWIIDIECLSGENVFYRMDRTLVI